MVSLNLEEEMKQRQVDLLREAEQDHLVSLAERARRRAADRANSRPSSPAAGWLVRLLRLPKS